MLRMYSVLIKWFWDHTMCLAISREDLIPDDVKKHCFDEMFWSVAPDKDSEWFQIIFINTEYISKIHYSLSKLFLSSSPLRSMFLKFIFCSKKLKIENKLIGTRNDRFSGQIDLDEFSKSIIKCPARKGWVFWVESKIENFDWFWPFFEFALELD